MNVFDKIIPIANRLIKRRRRNNMPAKIISVKAKTKEELKKKAEKEIKQAAQKGFSYIKQGYNEKKVTKIKDGYEIVIEVHS